MPTPSDPVPDGLDAVGVLAEPNRRALYDFVAGQRGWISREQAAQAVGLGRGVTSHHLDRLAEDGLLDVDYRRLNDRSGPGAGRPAKVYRRSSTEIAVSLPPRDYELAGQLLAAAAERSERDEIPIARAIDQTARDVGHAIGVEAKRRLGPRSGVRAERRQVLDALSSRGFEPEVVRGEVVLHNCPFHQLAQSHTDLICGMNLSLLDSVLDQFDNARWCARLEPHEDHCCVRLEEER
jgi:predicted ArsR family transcriptional regulator